MEKSENKGEWRYTIGLQATPPRTVTGLDKVSAGDGAIGDQASAVCVGGAVSDCDSLCGTDIADLWGTPETPILEAVEPSGLAVRLLVPSVFRAVVPTALVLAVGTGTVSAHVLVGKVVQCVGGLKKCKVKLKWGQGANDMKSVCWWRGVLD